MSVIIGLDLQTPERFVYDPAPDEIYYLRPITDEIRKHWDRITLVGKVRNRAGIEEERHDDEKRFELMVDHMFANWEGGIYLNAEDAKAGRTSLATLDNKLLFVSSQRERYLWALDVCQTMGERLAERVVREREDFRPTPPVQTGFSGD